MSGGGVGRVKTQRVVLFDRDAPLELESGVSLAPVQVAYETYGSLDADGRQRGARLPRAHRRRPRSRASRQPVATRLVGHDHRPGAPPGHGPLLHHLPQPPRRLRGHHRAVERRPGHRPRVWPRVPAADRAGSRHRPSRAAQPSRHHACPRCDRRVARRHAGAAMGARPSRRGRAGGHDLRQRPPERPEHRLHRRHARRDPQRPRLPGRELSRRPLTARPRPLAGPQGRPHHVPLGGVDAAQVRPFAP